MGTPCAMAKPSCFSRLNQDSFLMPPSLPSLPRSSPSPTFVDFYLPDISEIHWLLSISRAPSLPSIIVTFSLDLSISVSIVVSLHSRKLDLSKHIFLCQSSFHPRPPPYFCALGSVFNAPGDTRGKRCCSVARWCLTLCDPMDRSTPDFTSPGICSTLCPLSR